MKGNRKCLRLDIFYADLGKGVGSEQEGIRPVIIIQNDIGNTYSPTVIVSVISSSKTKNKIPTHLEIKKTSGNGLSLDSTLLFEQIRTIDKKRLREKIGHVDKSLEDEVNKKLLISLGLN